MAKIKVQNTEVTVITYNDKDYISLTDMVRNMENGPALIEKWLRNKNTVEFLGIWEEMYNPDFNSPEFEGIRIDKINYFCGKKESPSSFWTASINFLRKELA